MKMFLLSLSGLTLTMGGIYVMYTYILGIDADANIVFLILSLVLIGGGVFLLILAGKSDTLILNRVSKPEIDTEAVIKIPVKSEGLANKIEENNKMLQDWKKTNETKERLRMLEMSAAAEDSK